MFSLYKNSTGVQSTVKECVRFASTTKRVQTKIPVQLMKKHPLLGRKGEIVQVKPAYMRQKLYPNKYAVYTISGPRIPVVEKKVKTPKQRVVEQKTTETPVKQVKKVQSVSADELSTLFGSLQKSSRSGNTISIAEDEFISEASASQIRESIPETNFISKGDLPVTKEYLSTLAFNASGLQIPVQNIRIRRGTKEFIETVESEGEYLWLIKADEGNTVTLNITVQ